MPRLLWPTTKAPLYGSIRCSGDHEELSDMTSMDQELVVHFSHLINWILYKSSQSNSNDQPCLDCSDPTTKVPFMEASDAVEIPKSYLTWPQWTRNQWSTSCFWSVGTDQRNLPRRQYITDTIPSNLLASAKEHGASATCYSRVMVE